MPAVGELQGGRREDEMPAKVGEVNDDGVNAAVLLLLVPTKVPGAAVQGRSKGGTARSTITEYAGWIWVLVMIMKNFGGQ